MFSMQEYYIKIIDVKWSCMVQQNIWGPATDTWLYTRDSRWQQEPKCQGKKKRLPRLC